MSNSKNLLFQFLGTSDKEISFKGFQTKEKSFILTDVIFNDETKSHIEEQPEKLTLTSSLLITGKEITTLQLKDCWEECKECSFDLYVDGVLSVITNAGVIEAD